jgi:hypothetical protein
MWKLIQSKIYEVAASIAALTMEVVQMAIAETSKVTE